MKTKKLRSPDTDQEYEIFRIQTDNDLYAFRQYPPKFDNEFKEKLPDANKFTLNYLKLVYYTNTGFIDENLFTSTNTTQDFRKIVLGYRVGDKLIYCQDWEQVYDTRPIK